MKFTTGKVELCFVRLNYVRKLSNSCVWHFCTEFVRLFSFDGNFNYFYLSIGSSYVSYALLIINALFYLCYVVNSGLFPNENYDVLNIP